MEEEYSKQCSRDVDQFKSKDCQAICSKINPLFRRQNVYDIYRYCWYQTLDGQQVNRHLLQGKNELPPCVDGLGTYTLFNNPQARKLLNIPDEVTQKWEMCSEIKYKKLPQGSYYVYPVMMEAGYRIWVISGDTDAAVPVTGTLYWLDKLKAEFGLGTRQSLRPW
jgi:serine carboxypeptidase-like clade 2